MNATPSPADRELSRRQVLEIFGLGAAGTAFLAACGGKTEGKGGNANAPGGGGHEFVGAWPYQVPPKGHFNLMSGVTDSILGGSLYQDLVVLPGGMYYWADKKWELLLAEKYATDAAAKTFTMTIRSGITWSDGKPVTTKDVLSTFWCLRIMRNVVWNYLSKIEANGNDVVFTMNNPSTVVERYVLRQGIFSDATYGAFAKQAEALFGAGKDLDSPEGTKLNKDLQAHRPKELVVNGPFNFDYRSITNAQLTLVKNDKGYAGDKIKFDKITLYNGETPTVTPLVLSKRVDYATHGFPVATEKEFIKKGIRVLRPPVYSGPALFMNLDKLPEFKDVRVRQALAHAIDRNQNGTVSLSASGKGVKYMAGFSDIQVPDWLSSEDQGKLNAYEFDRDKAASMLTAAGWKKQGKNWMKPDGKAASYELTFPAEFADWSASGAELAKQLTDFGIQVKGRGVTFTQQPIDVDKGNFEFAIQGWGAGTPHPQFAFVADLFTHNIPTAKNQGGKGSAFVLKQKTKALGQVDLEKLVTASGEGLDEAAQKANVTKVAVAFNELLPIIPIFERYGNNAALEGTRVKAWPDDKDPILLNSPYADNFTVLLMITGKLLPA